MTAPRERGVFDSERVDDVLLPLKRIHDGRVSSTQIDEAARTRLRDIAIPVSFRPLG